MGLVKYTTALLHGYIYIPIYMYNLAAYIVFYTEYYYSEYHYFARVILLIHEYS